MYTLTQTDTFTKWLKSLADRQAKARIAARLLALQAGHFGDAKNLGDGVNELRIFIGAGYRVYYTIRGEHIVLLLCGGDKKSQDADIARAKKLLETETGA
jgi:putative addiction module killer protein